ncbi:MAG: hypothetical protein JSV94_05365 [Methanobacteriota archaeon]|nr:MAG: hypothetical protein JSV94_05365 [Euryarchaeota archaeon]
MALVESMEVLEIAALASVVVAAIVAIYELRVAAKDRKTAMVMQIAEFWCSPQWEDAAARLTKADFKTAQEAEDQLSLPVILMIADYLDYVASLARSKLVSKKTILGFGIFEYACDKLKPWMNEQLYDWQEPEQYGWYEWYSNLKWAAEESRKMKERERGRGAYRGAVNSS